MGGTSSIWLLVTNGFVYLIHYCGNRLLDVVFQGAMYDLIRRHICSGLDHFLFSAFSPPYYSEICRCVSVSNLSLLECEQSSAKRCLGAANVLCHVVQCWGMWIFCRVCVLFFWLLYYLVPDAELAGTSRRGVA